MYDRRLRESLPRVQERIEQAAARSGRGNKVRIIAVTKGHPGTAIKAAVAAGLRDCGENRVAELESKVEDLGRDAATWHLIGHLQRNKVRKAIPLFDVVHSIDSLRLAQVLSDEAVRAGMVVQGLVQVNASGEEAKGGIDIADDVSAGVDAVRTIAALPGLKIQGVMTMAPFVDDEGVLRTTFKRTRRLFDECAAQVEGFDAQHISMGMSNDYEIAVEEGSTMVRLGTILFGERAQ
ncbi:MAG TPA: YggS family pyridoxal phosphate-dependent enzyme [Longimicrobiales bacterium]